MKKLIGILLSLALIVGAVPITAGAADTARIIDKHGAKTYAGTVAAWGKTWNESDFEDITNKDYDCYGSLTVKTGEVGDITVSGSGSKVIVTSGTINSIESDGDVTLNGGSIKHDVESETKITLNGAVTVGGSCISRGIIATGSKTAIVKGSVIGTDTITLGGTAVKTGEINGDGMGTLDVKSYTLPLPPIVDMGAVTLTGNTTASGKIITGTLSIPAKTELTANSTVEVDTLAGPGTLSIVSGKLTVHYRITGKPQIRFNNTVGNGTLAFKADHGAVDEEDVLLYDYDLERNTSSNYDSFNLINSIKDGITLNSSSLSVDSKNPATVKAYVKPALTNFAAGTKIVWEMHGDTTAFSISPDAGKSTCTITSTKTGSYKVMLTAYLVDQRGDRLTDYKSSSCAVTTGAAQSPAGDSTLVLDTSQVTIPVGGTYWVLAITNSAQPPVQMSYNSAVATVGAASAYNSNGKIGWLYPVKGIAQGGVTIDIGGQKMITAVAGGSIIVDTSSYTMGPGGKYCIGVRISGIDRSKLNVYSTNGSASVQYSGASGGLDLYTVKGVQPGVGFIVFEIVGGQSVRTQINVVQGAKPGGVSGRLIAAG